MAGFINTSFCKSLLNKVLFLVLFAIMMIGVEPALKEVSATEQDLPAWLKHIAQLWANDGVTNSEYIETIQWLVDNRHVIVNNTNTDSGQVNPGTDGNTNTDSGQVNPGTDGNTNTDSGQVNPGTDGNTNTDSGSGITNVNVVPQYKRVNWSPELVLAYESWNPLIKVDFIEFYPNIDIVFENEFEVHLLDFDSWYPSFKEDYDSWSPEAQKSFDEISPFNEAKRDLYLNPELRTGFTNWSPEFFEVFLIPYYFNIDIRDCSVLLDDTVRVEYRVINDNDDNYNLDFDVLGVDTDGNTVTVGFSSVKVLRDSRVSEVVIIDDHPNFDKCELELVHFEKFG